MVHKLWSRHVVTDMREPVATSSLLKHSNFRMLFGKRHAEWVTSQNDYTDPDCLPHSRSSRWVAREDSRCRTDRQLFPLGCRFMAVTLALLSNLTVLQMISAFRSQRTGVHRCSNAGETFMRDWFLHNEARFFTKSNPTDYSSAPIGESARFGIATRTEGKESVIQLNDPITRVAT